MITKDVHGYDVEIWGEGSPCLTPVWMLMLSVSLSLMMTFAVVC